MKTKNLKIDVVLAFLCITTGLLAQADNEKRVHIKIDQSINGREIKIDTSFVGLSEAELKEQLIKLGVSDLPATDKEMGNLTASSENEDGNVQKTRIVTINHHNDGNGEEQTGELKNMEGSETKVVKDNGDMDLPAIDSAVKKEVIIKKNAADGKGTAINVSVKIKKVEDLSSKDKSALKSDVPAASKPFSELKVYPNPAEATLNILYKKEGSDPLVINIYDANGKTVYTENIAAQGERICKSIALNSFAPGIYFVQLTQGTQTDIKKVVVK